MYDRHLPKKLTPKGVILLMEEIRLTSWGGFYTSKRWLALGFLNHQQYHLVNCRRKKLTRLQPTVAIRKACEVETCWWFFLGGWSSLHETCWWFFGSSAAQSRFISSFLWTVGHDRNPVQPLEWGRGEPESCARLDHRWAEGKLERLVLHEANTWGIWTQTHQVLNHSP